MIISSVLLCGTLILFSTVGIGEETNVNILYVGGNGDGNYSSIHDAINVSLDEDIIIVYTGTYNENIEINKSISLIGEDKETTIIKSKNKFDVVTINAQWVNITGFNIQDGLVSGIWIENSGYCNIYQNNINDNSIGINIITSSNTNIFNNTISNSSNIGIKISKILTANN